MMKFYAMFVALGCAIMGLLAFSAQANGNVENPIYRVTNQEEAIVNSTRNSYSKSFMYVSHNVDNKTVRCIIVQTSVGRFEDPLAISCDWSDFSK